MTKNFKISPNIVHRKLNNKVILLEIVGSNLYELEDDVSIRVWELLVSGESLDSILETIEDEFDTTQGADLQIKEFIDSLVENGILTKAQDLR